MSQANVDRIRALTQEARSSDLDWLDPDVEVVDHDIPDAGSYRGHDGFLRWITDWGEAWSDFRMEEQEYVDAGDRVIVTVLLTARGRGSGVEVRRRDAAVYTFREGRVVRLDYFNNEADAFAAAGISRPPS